MTPMKNSAIVLAAGQGKRMNSKIQKQFLEVRGLPLVYYALKCFQDTSIIDEIILVTNQDAIEYCEKEIVEKYQLTKVKKIVAGGKERYDSVYAGLLACEDPKYVFIHDGARPFVDEEMLARGLKDVQRTGACVIGMPCKDTVKIANDHGEVESTPTRSKVWTIQTPQIFEYQLICDAHRSIRKKEMESITDDAMVVEHEMGIPIVLTEGSYRNIKVTTPEDILIAEAFLVH
ncbi:MAG: 2-C-methyl-D-erythritol 4-phosphate cytidylyltransferase [Eubacteriales bacterium]|nr:2-C-methyl-D-erythritol 4-phosphate cytidylyltransferase [Eubacteriales bacterium]